MNFDEEKVTAVLLKSGGAKGEWHVVKPGTFIIIKYGWNEGDAFEYKTSDGATVTGPVKSIIAVKTR